MARARSNGNGSTRLEEAMALLIQNQTAFLTRASETDRIMAETNRRMAETDRRNEERFARIEATLAEHGRILAHVLRVLEALPETLREKIGFKPPQKPAGE